jgi:hypothetical protein
VISSRGIPQGRPPSRPESSFCGGGRRFIPHARMRPDHRSRSY